MDQEVVQCYALNDEKDRERRRKNEGAEGGINVAREGGADGGRLTRRQIKLVPVATAAPRQKKLS